MLLRYPALATEAAGNGALPFRDATAWPWSAPGRSAWRRPTAIPSSADLEGFLAGLDPTSADLARDLLARLAAGGEDAAPRPRTQPAASCA